MMLLLLSHSSQCFHILLFEFPYHEERGSNILIDCPSKVLTGIMYDGGDLVHIHHDPFLQLLRAFIEVPNITESEDGEYLTSGNHGVEEIANDVLGDDFTTRGTETNLQKEDQLLESRLNEGGSKSGGKHGTRGSRG